MSTYFDRFKMLWGQNGGLEVPSDTNAAAGFEYLGSTAPSKQLFNWCLQTIDQKTNWLWREINTACTNYGLTPTLGEDDWLLQLFTRQDANLRTAISGVQAGRYLRTMQFTTNATYTPSPDAKRIIVEQVGGGGGGGGAPGADNSANPVGVGAAGACGAYVRAMIDLIVLPLSNVQLTVGAAGVGTMGSFGSAGSATGFGSYITTGGGEGGASSGSVAQGIPVWTNQSNGGVFTLSTAAGLTTLSAARGAHGNSGFIIASFNTSARGVPVPPLGPDSPLGTGGGNSTVGSSSGIGEPASGYGSGGGGSGTVGAGSSQGGNGAPGIIIITEMT